MIDINDPILYVQLKDGTQIPFDAAVLRSRIQTVCEESGIHEPAIAQNIAFTVEYTLTRKHNRNEKPIKYTELQTMIAQILENLGYTDLSVNFMKTVEPREAVEKLPLTGISAYLSGNFPSAAPAEIEYLKARITNTLRSIGAAQATPQLVLELAKHFLELHQGITTFRMPLPDFSAMDASKLILPDAILSRLTDEQAIYTDSRSLNLHPVFRTFPAIQIDIRLFQLIKDTELTSPLTELALAPCFTKMAQKIDELCLIYDKICVEKSLENLTPLPLLLNFADAGLFTKEWMDCRTPSACESCAVELAAFLKNMLTRQPFKFTCH